MTTSTSHTSDPPRRSRRKSPPTSLPDHFSRKGYLSVSDLVGPSWCEYNYQYGILSLSHLPPSQRPATITTEAGQVLAAEPQILARKETTLQAGKAVHTVLERQVAPVQVAVETETKEDSWALRLLNLWCDVQGLIQLQPGKGKGKEIACVREVPVYGWIHGVLVMGVVDEIAKRPIEITVHNEKGKTWSSQEEWKKSQSRKINSSPKKPKSASEASRPLTAFFGSSQPSTTPPNDDSKQAQERFGYFLSDTKTRISSWIPAPEDQFSARMQCMAYKRLFDGLLLGALASPRSTQPTSTHGGSTFDPNATPMDWHRTFASLQLDPRQRLSAAFLRDAQPVCESWGVDLALWAAQNDADVCTLDHVRLLLEEGLRGLAMNAGGEGGVIQDKLALTYRRQTRGRRAKRKTAEEGGEGDGGVRQATLHDSLTVAEKAKSASGDETPLDVEIAEQSTETQKKLDALEGKNDATHAIQSALSPPPGTPRLQPPASTSILGTVHFTHDPPTLDTHLRQTIAMWKGQRALVGVRPDQTRRCWTCEWIEGCEWRSSQADKLGRRREEPAGLEVRIEPKDEEEEFWQGVDYEAIQVRDGEGNLVAW